MRSAVTISLVPEAQGGPFVFWDGLDAGFAQAAALGFNAVEIFPPSADELDAGKIKELISAHKIGVAAIGTGAGWVKHKLRLTDSHAATRRRAREFVAAVVDFAGGFGAPAIIGSMQGRWGDGVSPDQALGWLAEALEELGPRAEANGVPLIYEPLNRYETNLFTRAGEASAFLGGLQTKNVKLLCDLFHMNIEEASIPDALREAGPLVGHVHFADSNRRAIGFGHTLVPPIVTALREIGYGGYLSAEILPLPNPETAAAQSIKAFREFAATRE
jgi:sugar phosphate isomerase/epimerase